MSPLAECRRETPFTQPDTELSWNALRFEANMENNFHKSGTDRRPIASRRRSIKSAAAFSEKASTRFDA